MSRFEGHIAWRYLFSKKGHNAINIVSGVSAASVCVVTAAMVCVLSVMNGFGNLVEHMFSEFDPEIKIVATDGKYFRTDTATIEQLHQLACVEAISEVVEETALVRYKEHQLPARLMGVDDRFRQITHIDSIISDGSFSVYDGAFDRCVMGRGLASQLGMNAHFVGGVHLYAPKRTERVNMLRPDESFCHEVCFISGTFAVNQVQYDDQLLLVSLPLARRIFQYDSLTVTSLSLRLKADVNPRQAKRQIAQALGNGYRVQDRYEQQEDFFRILKIEKLLTALLLVFILLIACFNVIGSLSMLMIDKREDIRILSDLGASRKQIQRIFRYEGWLISGLGAITGLLLGVAICLLQQHYGWLKLGNGDDYVISAYPVLVEPTDIVIVAAVVLLLGWIAAWYPTRKLSA